jgi:hypothetical protein
MADFITRLAERTLGTAPVVQPLVNSMFAPEPATRPTGLVWDDDIPTSAGDPDRTKSSATTEPARVAPWALPEHTEIQTEDQDIGVRDKHRRPSEDSNISSVPIRFAVSRPSERGITSGHEDRRTVLPATRSHPPETPSVAETDLFEDEIASGQNDQGNLSLSVLTQQRETLVDNGKGAVPLPLFSRDTRVSLDIEDSTQDSANTRDRSAPPVAPLVASSTVRPQLNGDGERHPREPHVVAPEPPEPTIRVNIGRIEVRAHMPPPPPATQRSKPARLGPKLSLDDYLNQRNRGQR